MNRLVTAVAVAALAAAAPVAQETPDFSGRWTLSSYVGNAGGGGGSVLTEQPRGQRPSAAAAGQSGGSLRPSGSRPPVGRSLVIRQDADAIVIEESFGDETRRIELRLGGQESVNVFGSVTLRTTSRWEGERLVTEGTQTVSTDQTDVTATFRETRWVTSDGTMVIETTRQLEGRDAVTSRAEYTRTAS